MGKVKDFRKKHGWLYAFLIGCVVFIVGIIVLIILVKNAINLFGLSMKEFQEYMNLLNREVNESTLASDPITNQDFISFKTKADEAGFKILDDKNDVNLALVTIPIESNITLSGYEVGAMLNSGFANNSDYNSLKILQFTITQGTYFKIKTVLKIDFTKIKQAIGSVANDLPNSIYLTCESVATASTTGNPSNRLILTDSVLRVNQLNDEENAKIIKLLNEMTSDKKDTLKFENLSDKIISEVITKIAQASNCYLTLGGGTLTLNKF